MKPTNHRISTEVQYPAGINYIAILIKTDLLLLLSQIRYTQGRQYIAYVEGQCKDSIIACIPGHMKETLNGTTKSTICHMNKERESRVLYLEICPTTKGGKIHINFVADLLTS